MDQPLEESPTTLYAHKKRREWGRAFLIWERNEKRGYLFEDGQEKVLARGFYGLMEAVVVPPEEFEHLRKRLGVAAHGQRTRASGAPSISFDEQLRVFRYEYPGGFQGATWQQKIRGKGAARRIKRHRDGAVADASKRLSQAEMTAWLSQQQYRPLWETAVDVLSETDLVPTNIMKKLTCKDAEQLRALAEALADLLHDRTSFDAHFDRFAKAVRAAFKTPSWQLVTAFPALLMPDAHLCVRPTSLKDNIKQIAPGVSLERWPTSAQYGSLRGVADTLRDKLVAAGEPPVDLLDVYDFVRLTSRPAAKNLVSVASSSTAPSSTPSAEGDDTDDTEAA